MHAGAVQCTTMPASPIGGGEFTSCLNPTAYQGICHGTCFPGDAEYAGFAGTLTAFCTGVDSWSVDNQCKPGALLSVTRCRECQMKLVTAC